MLTMSSAAKTHQGRVRKTNEDSMLVTDTIVAVADGLGGHAAGEVASKIAVDRLAELDTIEHVHPDDVIAAIADANRLIVDEMRRDRTHEGMGTTVTGLGVVDLGGVEQCVVFNVGDSRVYRWVDGVLSQVTTDHSEVEELRAAGAITSQDAATHPRRNVVTRCLGSIPAPLADVWTFPPSASERFVVCSDGLTNEVDDSTIADVLRDVAEPADAAAGLVEYALAAGGRDNIAVIVVDLTSTGAYAGEVDTSSRPAHS